MAEAGNQVTREGQTFEGSTKLSTYASFVKLPHTVFALPFALIGVAIASYDHALTWGMQRRGFVGREGVGGARRINAGAPAGLIRVDVSNPDDHPLIHEQFLH